jgi:chorismate--pyruvate lyase
MKPASNWRRWHAHRPKDAALYRCLRAQGSLTARLRAACRTFAVRCLRQGLARPERDVAREMRLPATRLVQVRDVLLLADGQPVVFARTHMPDRPRQAFDRCFAALGTRALGSVLFADPRIARGPLAFCRLDRRAPLYRAAEAALGFCLPRFVWARRSRFCLAGKDIWVSEVFLPALRTLPL